MKELYINIVEKIPRLQTEESIICNNTDYKIIFTFDSEWDAHPQRTARFIWNGKHKEVEFTGNVCPVPAITNASRVSVGVYAGELATTTPCSINCQKSILCAGSTLNTGDEINGIPKNAHVRYSANADGSDFTEEWSEGQRYIGFATAQTPPLNKEEYEWSLFLEKGEKGDKGDTGERGYFWELIAEIPATTADVASITINKDLNGNPFSLKQMKVIMYLPTDSASGYACYAVNNNGGPYVNPSSDWTGGTLEFDIFPCGDYVLVKCLKYGSTSNGWVAQSFKHINRWNGTGKYETINHFWFQIFNRKILAGATVKVYGERA